MCCYQYPGLIDDVHGYNFLAETSDVNDDYFHGTHLAGIVGAVCNNEIGVCGINTDGVVIQACKFLDSAGTGLISNAVKCIDYSLKSGAVLTLNSYGGYNQDSPTLRNAINAAERAGQLFITAAGVLLLSGVVGWSAANACCYYPFSCVLACCTKLRLVD